MESVDARKPFYQRGSFWLGPFTWGLGLLLAVGLGFAWYILGGFPRDHDKYGEVIVPGVAALSLPEGDVRLNFENHATRSGSSTTIDDQPPGLKVDVTPADGGEPLAVDDVPSGLFGSTKDDRGHEPFAKVDVPSAGTYLVSASADGELAPPDAERAKLASPPPSVNEGAAISVGQGPGRPATPRCWGRSSAASW